MGILALVIFLASSPSVIGLIIAPVDGKPTISLDICHPFNSCDQSPTIVQLAPFPQSLTIGIPDDSQLALEPGRIFIPRIDEAPDPPPPKQRI